MLIFADVESPKELSKMPMQDSSVPFVMHLGAATSLRTTQPKRETVRAPRNEMTASWQNRPGSAESMRSNRSVISWASSSGGGGGCSIAGRSRANSVNSFSFNYAPSPSSIGSNARFHSTTPSGMRRPRSRSLESSCASSPNSFHSPDSVSSNILDPATYMNSTPAIPFFPTTAHTALRQLLDQSSPNSNSEHSTYAADLMSKWKMPTPTFMDVFAPRIREPFTKDVMDEADSVQSEAERSSPSTVDSMSPAPLQPTMDQQMSVPNQWRGTNRGFRGRPISALLFDVREVTEDEASSLSDGASISSSDVATQDEDERDVDITQMQIPLAKSHFAAKITSAVAAEEEDDMPTPKADNYPASFASSLSLSSNSHPSLGSPIAFGAEPAEQEGNKALFMNDQEATTRRQIARRRKNRRAAVYHGGSVSSSSTENSPSDTESERNDSAASEGQYLPSNSIRASLYSMSSVEDRPQHFPMPDLHPHAARFASRALQLANSGKRSTVSTVSSQSQSEEDTDEDVPRRRFKTQKPRTMTDLRNSSIASLVSLPPEDPLPPLPPSISVTSSLLADVSDNGMDTPKQRTRKRSRDQQQLLPVSSPGRALRVLQERKAQLNQAEALLQLQRSVSMHSVTERQPSSDTQRQQNEIQSQTRRLLPPPSQFAAGIPRRQASLAASSHSSLRTQSEAREPATDYAAEDKRQSVSTVGVPMCSSMRKKKTTDTKQRKHTPERKPQQFRMPLFAPTHPHPMPMAVGAFSFEDMRALTVGLLEQSHSFADDQKWWGSSTARLPEPQEPSIFLKSSRSLLNLLSVNQKPEVEEALGRLPMSISDPELVETTASLESMQLRRISQMGSRPRTPETPSPLSDGDGESSPSSFGTETQNPSESQDWYGEPTPRSRVPRQSDCSGSSGIPAEEGMLRRAFWRDEEDDANMEERMEIARQRCRTASTTAPEALNRWQTRPSTPPPRQSSRGVMASEANDAEEHHGAGNGEVVSFIPFPSRPSFSSGSLSFVPDVPDSPWTVHSSLDLPHTEVAPDAGRHHSSASSGSSIDSDALPTPSDSLAPGALLEMQQRGGPIPSAAEDENLAWMLPFVVSSEMQQQQATPSKRVLDPLSTSPAAWRAPSPGTVARRLRCTSAEIKLAALHVATTPKKRLLPTRNLQPGAPQQQQALRASSMVSSHSSSALSTTSSSGDLRGWLGWANAEDNGGQQHHAPLAV